MVKEGLMDAVPGVTVVLNPVKVSLTFYWYCVDFCVASDAVAKCV